MSLTQFYINGAWVDPVVPETLDVINPATEEVAAVISVGSAADVDKAVAAAKVAFPKHAASSRAERLELVTEIRAIIHVIGIYCGVPQSLECFRAARKVLEEKGMLD